LNRSLFYDWPRVYDVILRLVPEFEQPGRLFEYRGAVNQVRAAYGVVWELAENGSLVRVLPIPAAAQVTSSIQELVAPQFQSARELLRSAQDAFNAIPRRERDTCANAFDAMEAVGRIRFGGNTFGGVLDSLQAGGRIDRFTLATLRSLEIVILRIRRLPAACTGTFEYSGVRLQALR
jgi:hypothetical protein